MDTRLSTIPIKILRAEEWYAFQQTGRFAGSADDKRDGFIHLSFGYQLAGTLNKYFASDALVYLLKIAPATEDKYKLEPSRDGLDFPHYYDALTLAEVTGTAALAQNDGFDDRAILNALETLGLTPEEGEQ